jgi:hypothetical protein
MNYEEVHKQVRVMKRIHLNCIILSVLVLLNLGVIGSLSSDHHIMSERYDHLQWNTLY